MGTSTTDDSLAALRSIAMYSRHAGHPRQRIRNGRTRRGPIRLLAIGDGVDRYDIRMLPFVDYITIILVFKFFVFCSCTIYSRVLCTQTGTVRSEALLPSDDLFTAIEMERFMTCLLLIVTVSTTAHNIY